LGRDLIKTKRVEQQIIRKSHKLWGTINEMCFYSKNLYNYANYLIRQEFKENNRYIAYKEMNKTLKGHESYKMCMSQPANATLRNLDKVWISFFRSIKDWKKNKHKYVGMPRLPDFLKKNGRYPWMIPNNSCYFKDGELKFRIKKLHDFAWKTNAKGRLIQVRFIPRGTCYVMEVVTEVEIPDFPERESSRIASIDLGVNNFVTLTNNIGLPPIIINGRGIKSINQFYNKRRAELRNKLNNAGWSNQLSDITIKRFFRIKNFMHHVSKYIVNYCIENNIDTLICGKNDRFKHKVNIGHKNNQDIQYIPLRMFLLQLNYKCEENGIKFIVKEENYTSGTSFLDNEEPIKDNYNIKRRIKRGLFKSNNGTLINADVNGSLQIMRKVFPNAFADGIVGCLIPSRVNLVCC
jgi:putative transposase